MAIEIFRIDTIDDLKEHVKSVTARAREKVAAPEEKDGAEPKSEMAKSLLSVWDKADFGCQAAHVGQILHILVREVAHENVEFKRRDDDDEDVVYDYPRFSAVVPLNKASGHSYAVGRAFVVNQKHENGNAIMGIRSQKNDRHGNNHFGSWRYATDEEIDDLFKTFDGDEEKILSYFE